jgi:phenylpropionate dioxygenase-like ring-hydroxylating dioxygenase large terminal subunit
MPNATRTDDRAARTCVTSDDSARWRRARRQRLLDPSRKDPVTQNSTSDNPPAIRLTPPGTDSRSRMETEHLLPARAYWADEWFEREQDLLFSHAWHLVCSEEDLPEPGAYVTYRAGHDPLVVTRDLGGRLRAFHNLCTHRAMTLVEGCGQSRSGLVCPYHFWSFGLDGELRKVPQPEQFPDLDVGAWGLAPASVGAWGGMVFVHPDADTPPLAEWMGDLPTAIGSHRPELLTEVAHYQMEARCNWKLFVENHVDVYHLWYLHARTLAAADHDRFEWRQLGPHWVSYEPLKDGISTHRPHHRVADLDHLEARDRKGVGAHALFPNILMASEGPYFITYACRPVAPDRSVIDLRVRSTPDADVEALLAGAKSFIVEDIAACEGVQRNVRSHRFAIGPMAVDHERPITLFHQHLRAVLEPDEG